ncbi:hypothetical protein OHT57_12860 [Streptomyces sp. NBC_00285]|nr:hypothetical protein [Streptomyces sp. NBC_00285]
MHIAKAVDATDIGLENAPRGNTDFDQGASRGYVLDPRGVLSGFRPG